MLVDGLQVEVLHGRGRIVFVDTEHAGAIAPFVQPPVFVDAVGQDVALDPVGCVLRNAGHARLHIPQHPAGLVAGRQGPHRGQNHSRQRVMGDRPAEIQEERNFVLIEKISNEVLVRVEVSQNDGYIAEAEPLFPHQLQDLPSCQFHFVTRVFRRHELDRLAACRHALGPGLTGFSAGQDTFQIPQDRAASISSAIGVIKNDRLAHFHARLFGQTEQAEVGLFAGPEDVELRRRGFLAQSLRIQAERDMGLCGCLHYRRQSCVLLTGEPREAIDTQVASLEPIHLVDGLSKSIQIHQRIVQAGHVHFLILAQQQGHVAELVAQLPGKFAPGVQIAADLGQSFHAKLRLRQFVHQLEDRVGNALGTDVIPELQLVVRGGEDLLHDESAGKIQHGLASAGIAIDSKIRQVLESQYPRPNEPVNVAPGREHTPHLEGRLLRHEQDHARTGKRRFA